MESITNNNSYSKIFNLQKENQFNIGNTSYKERIKKLDALKNALENTYKEKIRNAIYSDFKKPVTEIDLTEIYPVISEIKYIKRNLKSWLRRKKVTTPLALIGTSSYIKYEPKGVCLLISPWNFPINLTFSPLVAAIAAGNTVIIKPSEITPNTSAVIAEIIKDLFKEDEVSIVLGGAEESQALLKLPFNHIFFTGAPSIGKIVMKAAAENLSSVTLELGGKSPTIIDKTANIKETAKKIAWGKFINNGQTCIAPDYVFIQEDIKDDFIKELKLHLNTFYTENASSSDSYCRIVNTKHFNRLVAHLNDAKKHKATFELGGTYNTNDNYIAPTVISNIPKEATLLQDEIFGPILPIIYYKNITEAIGYINSNEKPLALYIYSNDKELVNQVINNTRAGSTCINNNVLQFTNHYLPFGGSNNSGIGKSHGFFGFQEFSNQRSILKQNFKSSIELLFPPYTKQKQKITDATIKWF